MAVSDLLSAEDIRLDLGASTKKQALQTLADFAGARAELDGRAIFEAVLERERLGSTGVGSGVGIPHARVEATPKVRGFFARLDPAVEFDAMDGQPVDLVFLLLAPEDAGADHLKALARVSRLLRRDEVREQLRAAPTAEAVHAILSGSAQTDAA
ncbi:MAG: PTS sugar transporter subunit IIA [Maricaulaceae bacterium]